METKGLKMSKDHNKRHTMEKEIENTENAVYKSKSKEEIYLAWAKQLAEETSKFSTQIDYCIHWIYNKNENSISDKFHKR